MRKTVSLNRAVLALSILILVAILPGVVLAEAAGAEEAAKVEVQKEVAPLTLTRPEKEEAGQCYADARQEFERSEPSGRASCSGSCSGNSCSCSGSLSCCVVGCVICWDILDQAVADRCSTE